MALTKEHIHTIASEVFRELAQEIARAGPGIAVVCFTGGQMGAGKSSVVEHLIQHRFGDSGAIISDPDEFRNHIPEVVRAVKENTPLPETSFPDSGKIAEAVEDLALKEHYNLVIDGTLKSKDWILSYVKKIVDLQYSVEIHIAVLHPERSLLATFERREINLRSHPDNYGRHVPPTVHQDAVTKFPETVRELWATNAVERIVLHTWDGVLFDTRFINGAWSLEDNPADIVAAIHSTSSELLVQEIDDKWEQLIELVCDPARPLVASDHELAIIKTCQQEARDRLQQLASELRPHHELERYLETAPTGALDRADLEAITMARSLLGVACELVAVQQHDEGVKTNMLMMLKDQYRLRLGRGEFHARTT